MEKISWIDGVRNEILITVKAKEHPTINIKKEG